MKNIDFCNLNNYFRDNQQFLCPYCYKKTMMIEKDFACGKKQYYYIDEHKIKHNTHMSYGYRVARINELLYINEIDHFFTHAINNSILM